MQLDWWHITTIGQVQLNMIIILLSNVQSNVLKWSLKLKISIICLIIRQLI